MEWDYSGRKGRDGQKKIGKANERKGKVKKGGKDEEVNGQGGKRGAPAAHGANVYNECFLKNIKCKKCKNFPTSCVYQTYV